MYGAVRTVATTGETWAIVIVAVLVTAFLVSATAVAYGWQNRYHRRMRAAGLWDAVMIQNEDDVPRPEVDAPGIISTAAGRMGPAGEDMADTLPARAAVAPMEETAAGSVHVPGHVPAPRSGSQAAPAHSPTPSQAAAPAVAPVSDEELAAQAEAPTRPDLPAQRAVRESERAQPTVTRPGATEADDPGRM
jgi:hypothetical protein